MASLIAEGKQQYFSNAGLPLVGGKLYTYIAGTTTPKLTYTDADGLNPNTNPIILDARGEATVFWSGSYKVELRDALDNVIWTVDKVTETNLGYRTSSTGSAIIPAGTTVQRDAAPLPGYFRYNVDNNNFEGYYSAAWRPLLSQVNGANVPNDGNFLIKTVNGLSVIGSGDLPLKTVGGVSLNGAGDIAVQAPLVSGTNIKTIEGVSVLGAGDIDFKTVAGVSLLGSGDIPITVALTRSARSSNTILGVADRGTFIDITSGTFSQTFTAAATLTSGWFVYFRNSGTGDITLDPNGAELIDGLASYIMYPGETRLIQCTGTAFTSIVLSSFEKIFTANGTFTKPPGYNAFVGEIWNGGASGRKGTSSGTPGGGGGGCFPFVIPASAFAATEAITVGLGGAAVAVAGPGLVGNPSSIGTLLVMGGHFSGLYYNGSSIVTTAAASPGNSGTGFESASGNTVASGSSIYGGAASSSNGIQPSGSSVYGGGAGGAIDNDGVTLRAPGTSVRGGNGGAASVAGVGTAGTAPGGGGGGTVSGANSGAGARGEVRIRGE